MVERPRRVSTTYPLTQPVRPCGEPVVNGVPPEPRLPLLIWEVEWLTPFFALLGCAGLDAHKKPRLKSYGNRKCADPDVPGRPNPAALINPNSGLTILVSSDSHFDKLSVRDELAQGQPS